MKISIKKLSVLLLFCLLINKNTVFAKAEQPSPFQLQAYGIDTIAGYSASIYSSRTLPNKNVIFNVQKPNGDILSIPIITNDSGVAEFDLYDLHTKKAGIYNISAKLEGGTNGTVNTFEVFADEVSDSGSQVNASKLIADADGKDKIYITVLLADQYGNPIANHSLEAISSRSEDVIQKLSESGTTDENGEIMFNVSSSKKGVSAYTFFDTTTNKILTKRLEIAYTGLQNAGGDINTVYAAAGEVSKLNFEDLPTSVQPNSDISFTLSALDSEDALVPNYSGSVHFSAEGSNSVYAQLPNDYTFDVDLDGGSHEFSGPNSLNFSQAGTYTVVATDLEDFTIRGEAEIIVGSGGSQTPPQGTHTATDEAIIDSPTQGTYSDKQLPITGSVPDDTKTVQIFDNDQNIGSTSAEDNSFTFQPTVLAEGIHKIFAVALDSESTILSTSDEVEFTIDTTAPEVTGTKFTPSKGIKTGDVIDIVVTSDANVFQGAVVFNVDIAELEQDPNEPTHYLASIQAPQEAGSYPIDVILVDELGNEGTYEDVSTVEVSESGVAQITDEENPPVEEPPEDEIPGDVFGVRSVSGDTKITLSWQSASDDKGISKYKIYYGLSPANLNMSVETKDAAGTWYIPNLQNGNEYFFAVSAIDSIGQESENKSSIVSGIPFSAEPILYLPPEQEPEVRPTAPVMQSSGPEILWFAVASIFISKLYFKFRKKVC